MTIGEIQSALQVVYLGLVPLAGAVAWVIGLVLHGLGRNTAPIRRFVVYAVGVAIGATVETSLAAMANVGTLPTIINGMFAVGIPLAVIVGLAMFGRRQSAGLLLAGLSTPWLLVSAAYLLDVLRGGPWAPLFTVAMTMLGVGGLLAGVALAMAGDPVHDPDPAAPMGRPGSRRTGSMAGTFMRDATYFAIGPSFVLVLLVATGIGLALPGQPLLQAGAVVVAAVVGTEVELRWVPRPQRPALEAFHWVGLHDVAAFKAQTGSSVPAGVGGLKAWLVRHPETDATRPWRIEVLTAIGELTRARDELSRLVPGDGIDRMRRASLATEVDWVSGGPADVAGLATIAAEVGSEGSDERLFADGMVAWWESRIRLAALDPDWRTPLGAFRGRLGDAAAGLHVRTMRRRTIVLPLLFGLGFVLISLVGTGAADLVPARP